MFLRITTNDSNKENTEKNLRDEFFYHVLNWNPDWFRDKKYQKKLPNVINNIKLTPTKLHYNNVDEYQKVMLPQLIYEYWFTLQKDYEAFFKEKRCEEIPVEIHNQASLRSKILFVSHSTRSLCCFGDNKQECTHPRSGDLVELFINRNKYFAYVTSKTVCREKWGVNKLNFQLLLDVSFTKNSYHGRFDHATITSITFLETCLGMVDGLNCLGTFPLCKSILSPNAAQYRMPSKLKLQLSDITTKANPNPSQLKVISGIIGAIEEGTPKICLVQGPPGTGKSNTIVNLIAEMIKRKNNIRFLVCAASNKAVDSLALQLIKIKPTLEGQNIPFLVVRVGNREKVDEDVQGILLERLANELRIRREKNSRENMSFEETHEEYKETILMNSQVITSTLASCYTKCCMRKFFSENSFIEELVCIIDEAAQANELLTLIPLLLGVKFLFLVGDHQQLEPIALSQTVKRYGYNSSLFSRAQKIFREEKKNPIVMLDTQYRMEKSISSWPNKYFYKNRLKDAASVNSLGICNYMLFDHNFPQNSNGHSNEMEAQLVVKLILFLRKKLNLKVSSKITIGVITPYHEQRTLIQKLLNLQNNELPKKFPKLNKKTRKLSNDTESDEKNEIPIQLFENLKLNEKSTLETENNVDENKSELAPISEELLKNLQLDFKNNEYNDDDDDIMIYKIINISQELFDNLRRDFGFEVEKNKDVEVNTVDSFQGSERDIIIISCVRSHELGFTGNPNRLNVSITRAKHTLIMLGNFKAFERNSMWSNLIRDAEQRNVLVPINEDNAEFVFEQYVSHKFQTKSVVPFQKQTK